MRAALSASAAMQSIETGTFLGRIPYAKVGDDQNPILVINGGQGFMMTPNPARMLKDAKRLARILPNGRSFILLGYDPGPAAVTVEELAHDVAKIIEQHAGGRTDVMGISYGGVVASTLARQSPENVGRLVLMASAHRFSEEGKRRIQRQIQLIEAGDLQALLREFATMFKSPVLNWLLALRIRFAGASMSRKLNNPKIIIRYLEAMLKSETTGNDLRTLYAPTLIIAGSRDQFFADAIEEAGASIQDVRLSVFEGETHMVPVERAAAVKQALETFLYIALADRAKISLA
jgi:pimeloyl-ACP methyl ester carboxylesterase